MKIGMLALLFLTPVFIQEPVPKRLGELDGISRPHSLHVVGDDLVFLDGFTVHVYSLHPLEPKRSFAGEGDRPDQFKYWPQLLLQGDTLVGIDYLKTSWFSVDGELLKTISYDDFPDFDTGMEMVLRPAGENLIRVTVDHESSTRFVQLFDRDLELRNPLYEGLYDWRGGLPPFRIDVDTDAGYIVVSDSERGFFLSLFDTEGTPLRTIDKSAEIEPIPFTDADRAAYLESVRVNGDPRLYEHLRRNGQFKDHFPLINQVQIDDGKLYVTTEKVRAGRHELLVLDLEGRILERLFLPLKSKSPSRSILRFDPYVVHDGKLYEMVRVEGTQAYELWVTDLGS